MMKYWLNCDIILMDNQILSAKIKTYWIILNYSIYFNFTEHINYNIYGYVRNNTM